MKRIPNKLQKYAEELDGRDFNHDNFTDEGETFERLLSLGVMIPYADAMVYKDKAILVCGSPAIGKTKLVDGLEERLGQKAKRLAYDFPTMYWDGKSKPVVYDNDTTEYNQKEFPFLVPFLFPGEVKEYTLEMMIFLKAGKSEGPLEETNERNIFKYFFE